MSDGVVRMQGHEPVALRAAARPLIEVRDVHKHYGDYHALRGLNLTIREGEFFSLLGPSGCGKTTLLRTIAGFEDVSAGQVLIDGQDMDGVPANRRPTNMVFQSYAVFPHLSVAQNVGFGLRRRRNLDRDARQALVEGALDMVGLAGLGGRAAHALSGGQRQRVALARALILRPKVLLLDEPLSALDKKMRQQMQSELRRLQRHVGITFILVTHDQEEALIMSDRIAVMFEGEIAQLDAPESLYGRPVSRRVAEFIGVMNFVRGRVDSFLGDVVTLDIEGLGRAELSARQVPGGTLAGDISVGLRPETMTVLLDGVPERGRVAPGRIVEETYYGDMTYYLVALDGVEAPMTISMRNLPGRDVLDPGTPVRVAWDPRSLVVFP